MRFAPAFVAATAFIFSTGWAQDVSRPDPDRQERSVAAIVRLSDKLDLKSPSFQTSVPPELQTLFEPQPNADDRSPTLRITSSGDRLLFPIPEKRRRFDSMESVQSFIATTFGGRSVSNQAGKAAAGAPKSGIRGSYIWLGDGFFVDPKRDTIYRVTDPIMAHLGGAHGVIEIDGKAACVDPDGKCDEQRGEYASYLEPLGEPTAPTHLLHCGRPYAGTDVCVQHHSFFNKGGPIFMWARHGANVRFTYFAPLPSTRLSAGGDIWYAPDEGPPIDRWPLRNVANVAQGSIETAEWSFGCSSCITWNARAVCGQTSVNDPDVSGTRNTGNGPDNNAYCD